MAAEHAHKRKLLHTRRIVCTGYEREDGLYEIEGQMQDISADATELLYRDLEAGGVIHDMRLSLTFDAQLLIHDAHARIDASPTPFCADIQQRYQQLVGQRMVPGFTHTVKRLFGGTHGCTHLSELLGPIATTAYQTLFAVHRENHGRRKPLPDSPWLLPKPATVGTCHALRTEGPVAEILWPLDRRLDK